MKNLNIAIGSDHAGFGLKEIIKEYISNNGYKLTDFGVCNGERADYPVISKEIATQVVAGKFDRGIVICGSGLGVAIAANKVKGIRAVTCHDTYSSKMSRAHNDANILTMGGRVVGPDLACDVVKIWLETEFEGGRHQTRVDMLEE